MGLTTRRSLINTGRRRGWGRGRSRWERSGCWELLGAPEKCLEAGKAPQGLQGGPGSTERASVLQCARWGCLEALLELDLLSWWNVGLHRARSTLEHPDLLWDSWWSRNVEVGSRKMTMSHLVVFFLTITTKTLDPDLLTNLTLGQSLHLLVFRLKTVPSIVGANHLPVNWCHSKSTLSNPAGPSALFWSHLLNLRTPSPLHRHISPPPPSIWALSFSRGDLISFFTRREAISYVSNP